MTKPGVLIVGNFFVSERGGRAVCQDLAERLTASGWHVRSTSWRAARAPRLFDMVSAAWRHRGAFDVACVDVFSGAAFAWAEAVCLTLRAAGKPYVLVLRGGNLPAFAARHPRQVRWLLQSASRVVAPSSYLRDAMAPYRRDVVLQPNPIDVAAYPCTIRRRLRPNLVWLRAFHRIYNPSLAVAVLARLADEYPDATLTMIGPDKGDGALEATRQAAADANVLDRITCIGPVHKRDVGRWLSEGDVFLNTALVDNAPVTVLEAMACGLPVVTTNVGGLPSFVRDGQDALLVSSNDPVAMAAAVRRLLKDPTLAASLSMQAHRTAALCDWSEQLPRWERLLSSVCVAAARSVIVAGSVPDA